MTRTFGLLVVLLAGLFSLGAWGSWQWQKDTSAAISRLDCVPVASPLTYDPALELQGLPAPVQRYFRNVLRPGQVIIRKMRNTQQGEFQMGSGWRAMQASQISVARNPGFLWDARIAMVPGLLNAQVRDSYARGTASMTAKVLGLVTLMDAVSAPELAAGALQRYLGEAIWFPTALLPSQGVVWTPIDDNAARATLKDHGVTASLDFAFTPSGEITGTYTDARFREEGGKYTAQPWGASCWNYADRGGVRIPLQAEVSWILDGKRVPYWRARIVEIEFE
jgi:hypothetical protein